jgi:hypothetical protein
MGGNILSPESGVCSKFSEESECVNNGCTVIQTICNLPDGGDMCNSNINGKTECLVNGQCGRSCNNDSDCFGIDSDVYVNPGRHDVCYDGTCAIPSVSVTEFEGFFEVVVDNVPDNENCAAGLHKNRDRIVNVPNSDSTVKDPPMPNNMEFVYSKFGQSRTGLTVPKSKRDEITGELMIGTFIDNGNLEQWDPNSVRVIGANGLFEWDQDADPEIGSVRVVNGKYIFQLTKKMDGSDFVATACGPESTTFTPGLSFHHNVRIKFPDFLVQQAESCFNDGNCEQGKGCVDQLCQSQ